MITEVPITQVFIQNKVKADHAEVSTHPITREKQRYLCGIVEISKNSIYIYKLDHKQ